MRDVLEAIVTHPARRRSGDARRDPALHEAVLDQHRPVQQPDRAQVRADVHAGGVCRGGARGRASRRARSRCRTARRSTQLLARLQPMFFDPERRSDRHQQDAAAGQGHPHGERQQPVRRRDDEGSRGLRRAAPAQLAAREDATAGSSKRSTASAAATARRSPRSSSTSRRRFRSPPSRWPRRCAR